MRKHFRSKSGRLLASYTLLAILFPTPAGVTPRAYAVVYQDRGNDKQAPLIGELPPSQKRFALIIGVNKYKDGRISSLTASANDADTLAEALIKYAGFPREHVIVLASNKADDFQPEHSIIREYVSTLSGLAGKDGLFLMAYSGHGYEMDGQVYLLGSDARLAADVKVMKDSCVAWSEITESIDDANVGQVIIMLDACRSDPRTGKGVNQRNQMTQIYEKGLYLGKKPNTQRPFIKMLATQKGEQAFEDTSKNLGFFINAMVEGLRGEGANQSGVVTLTSLWRYVEEKVQAYAKMRGRIQRPVIEIQSYDQAQLVIVEAPPHLVGSRREETAIPAENSVLAELGEWIRVRKSGNKEEYEKFCARFPSGNFCEDARNRVREIEAATNPKTDSTIETSVPNSTPLSADLAHVHKGDQFLSNNNFSEAEKEYRTAIGLNPNEAMYYGKLGIALYHQREYKEAEAEYKKAIKLAPYTADLFYNLGLALLNQEKYSNAETEFRKAVRINPNVATFHAYLGTTLSMRGKLKDAELEIKQAIMLSPNDASHHHLLGNCLAQQKKYQEAEGAYEAAVHLDPQNPIYKKSLQNLKKVTRH